VEKPKIFGIWSIGDVEEDEPEEMRAEINGTPLYCPICKRELKMWVEGCSLVHFVCKKCRFRMTRVAYLDEEGELDLRYYDRLVEVAYED